MLDIVDAGGQRALVEGHDAARHVIRRQAGIAKDDADHRNVDAREDVNRRAEGRPDAEDHDQQRHDDECVGSSKRKLDDADHRYDPLRTPLDGATLSGTLGSYFSKRARGKLIARKIGSPSGTRLRLDMNSSLIRPDFQRMMSRDGEMLARESAL